ncbi:L-threonylcarbamoyladenylate synthase [Staphylococcus massiliensis]|uniref:Threonylcarbamoyl-AMP synthase n=1 Tax=Staphylococcus massiliensis S46 TaxID=1229783 RepID=K9AX73_9STAP|nr:L-threonylcarbamoyladenylate synthase [Staphylococcus massiliensis]EKU47172.1 translation factor [Staphylococcus massiliensis S46]MCG3400178.1 threonylcarbamoyl-AMP synthase [Staphylococcus massiliensis]MCG3402745.1 threonylcarbamoyl-AMP synthase [Staphylococcus massiliensis]MCG3413521.1 threonylcarbamoyl-AMP synthase [Staphylococcus massiliensis]PNZ99822.1 threonylcarbamoyl-AMP synthase [Staphylococcus massiliensis CCUG 55927]
METRIWDLSDYQSNVQDYPQLEEIIQCFNNGGLVCIPTETVYGLGANAYDDEAITNVFKAKGRPQDNPLIVHIHDLSQLDAFTTSIHPEARTLMKHLWPGPISFIVPLKQGVLSEGVSRGLDSIAVRMPSDDVCRQILKAVDLPIAAPSANISGRPSPTTFEHVYHDMDGRVDGIIRSIQSEAGLESTVVDCRTFPFKIARPGVITKHMLNSIVSGCVDINEPLSLEKPIAPGMKYKHYAPDVPLTILLNAGSKLPFEMNDWQKVAFIYPERLRDTLPQDAIFIPLCKDETDITGANRNLYASLHQLDALPSIEQAFIYGFDGNEDNEAIMNRMEKAANYNIIRGE